jgi:hypothetical protein
VVGLAEPILDHSVVVNNYIGGFHEEKAEVLYDYILVV